VDGVTCDNPHNLEYAAAFNPNVHLVPDPCQVEFFQPRQFQRRDEQSSVVIGWIGSPETAFNLYHIWEILERIFKEFPCVHLRLVGVGSDRQAIPPFENVRYSAVPYYDRLQMIEEISHMDIGIFPLFDVEDSLARGVLKAEVYMAGGACVVADPIGQISELVTHRATGFLPKSPQEWYACLAELVTDGTLRQAVAASARDAVRSRYSLQTCYSALKTALIGSAC
jgi:glycosyltransferase involved in cell wall biosynthesis